jgi:hypothetical protein
MSQKLDNYAKITNVAGDCIGNTSVKPDKMGLNEQFTTYWANKRAKLSFLVLISARSPPFTNICTL